MANNKGSLGTLLKLDLVLHSSCLLEICRILHIDLCPNEGEHIAAAHGVFGQGVAPGLVTDQRNPVLIINHLENLIAVRVGQHNSGRTVEIQNSKRIQRVEIRAQNRTFLGILSSLLMEKHTHAISAGAFGDLAYVVGKNHLRFCKGVVGLCYRCH